VDPADQADRTDRVKYRILVASAPVAIDGIMDDEAWADAVAIDVPYEVASAPQRVL
jgi:hypothetical protein